MDSRPQAGKSEPEERAGSAGETGVPENPSPGARFLM